MKQKYLSSRRPLLILISLTRQLPSSEDIDIANKAKRRGQTPIRGKETVKLKHPRPIRCDSEEHV